MKLPPHPPADINYTPEDLSEHRAPLWRIASTSGPWSLPWNELRHWGPREQARFEPHPAGPPAIHPKAAVMYSALDFYTAFAEVFIGTRVIDTEAGSPTLISWEPTRPLRLLDLTARTVTASFGSAAMQMTEDRTITQAWARALFEQHGNDIDGIRSTSSVDNGQVITLFPRAKAVDSFPFAPTEHLPLRDAGVYVELAARRLRYGVV